MLQGCCRAGRRTWGHGWQSLCCLVPSHAVLLPPPPLALLSQHSETAAAAREAGAAVLLAQAVPSSSGRGAHVRLVGVVVKAVEEVGVDLGLLARALAPLVQVDLVGGLEDVAGVVGCSGPRARRSKDVTGGGGGSF